MTDEQIKERIKNLPNRPGVYQYLNKEGRIIYVGKAKNLKKRVSSYFTKKRFESGKTKMLVSRIVDIKYIVVKSEADALLLENSLIKEYQPKYNIQLRDDKTYPWICIKKEPFPRVFSTRRIIKDGSEYFGPYTSVKRMKSVLELARRMYPLRTCSYDLSKENIEAGKFRVCLEYHIKNCMGPCEGKQSEEEYGEYIHQVREIIKGNVSSLIKALSKRMEAAAEELDFELADKMKRRIELLENFQSKSIIVSPYIDKTEVYAVREDDRYGYVSYFRVVNGAIVNAHVLDLKKQLDETPGDLLELAIGEMRQRVGEEVKEILTSHRVEVEIEGVTIHKPQRGDKKSLIDLADKNAAQHMLDKHKQEKLKNPDRHVERIMNTMMKDLRMMVEPRHIECFDNSNIQGTNPVAACVVFRDGKPSKKEYRHFNIKTVIGPDDFASMEEVVHRRYKRLMDNGEDLPQLIVIDGGKGQLSSAVKSLERLGLRGQITIIGIAKRLEEIYFPGDSVPLYLDKRSETLKVIQHARNEAHRFGITHHRSKRSKAGLKTSLTDIEGIGEKTYQQLILKFKSVKRVKNSTMEELQEVIGESKGARLYYALHPEG